ncbi:monovalent cation/H(+) antiporter subunit G [Neoroseomonas lacus]|uniref:Cation:proton antiporter n=1 Tax=Neoroseomonas lacus TaxID=287609 RepID=A0A917KHM8_9PROT|nr:monovalent cation/H(+) antiporter subunit G [Neoroseomonas lacus]GGJ12751.1 cation:proton antiporter [Neoroseomonas lacus]
MTLLVDAFTILAVLAGLVFFIAGTTGLLRFPDTASRLHALTKADHLGLGLIVLGLLPRAAGIDGALRLLAIWGLVLLSSAAVGPMIARLARLRRPGE